MSAETATRIRRPLGPILTCSTAILEVFGGSLFEAGRLLQLYASLYLGTSKALRGF